MMNKKLDLIEFDLPSGKGKIHWRLNEQVNILTGNNGSGKTRLLNAIYRWLTLDEVYEQRKIHVEMINENGEVVCPFVDYVEPLGELEKPEDRHLWAIQASRQMMGDGDTVLSQMHERYVSVANSFLDDVGLYVKEFGLAVSRKGSGEFAGLGLSNGVNKLLDLLYRVAVLSLVSDLILIDIPETGLSVQWQERLIKALTLLAPKAQFIITTHSPAIIMDGWNDVYVDILEVTKND